MFAISDSRIVVIGTIVGEKLQVGDNIRIQDKDGIKSIPAVVDEIEMLKNITVANTNDKVGVLLNNVTRQDLEKDNVIVKL